MSSKERLDILLVNRGLFESREKAKAAIMAGLIFMDTTRIDKAGTKVPVDANILVKGNTLPYVSRGGLKLEKAIQIYPIDLQDAVMVDIGASTGGFTDCALQNGASKVFAIDVGYNQLAWKLRQDSRVINMEKQNIRTVTPEQLGELYSYLLDQAGKIREELPEDENGNAIPYGDHQDIFRRAQAGYDIAGQAFEALNGHYGKAKAVFASPLKNYTGITGIYSPFTGEPNINIAVPPITIPSTTCHEMAHQRGYGFESECNFIAYITSMANPDLDFQYSAYIMAISYTSNALAQADREILLSINATMSDKVYKDLVNINEFWDSYKGGVKETAEQINNAYLQSNGVESGTESYGEMVNLLLALYDKYH